MRKLVLNTKTVIVALIGLIGGFIWALLSKWEPEPIILLTVSAIELIAFAIIKGSDDSSESQPLTSTINHGNVNVNVNVDAKNIVSNLNKTSAVEDQKFEDREARIDFMKSRSKVLFIDDDKNFNVVKILKESGWRHTKNIPDVKNIDIPIVKDSQILFVDINGVGKLLNLPYEGLDLSLMIKQRYPEKRVVIYSANRTTNAFHQAWDICDFRLEKNALPNQFQNLVEKYSIELYNTFK